MDDSSIKLVRLCPKCGPTTSYGSDQKCTVCGEYTKEEVISGDAGGGGITTLPATSYAGTADSFSRKKRMCADYGKEIAEDAKFCPYHGIDIPAGRVSESTITGIAAIGGIFGFHGLGHIIFGKMVPGFFLLFAGWALIAGMLCSYFILWEQWEEQSTFAVIAILALAYIVLFIWQVMDANNIAKLLNIHYENHRIKE